MQPTNSIIIRDSQIRRHFEVADTEDLVIDFVSPTGQAVSVRNATEVANLVSQLFKAHMDKARTDGKDTGITATTRINEQGLFADRTPIQNHTTAKATRIWQDLVAALEAIPSSSQAAPVDQPPRSSSPSSAASSRRASTSSTASAAAPAPSHARQASASSEASAASSSRPASPVSRSQSPPPAPLKHRKIQVRVPSSIQERIAIDQRVIAAYERILNQKLEGQDAQIERNLQEIFRSRQTELAHRNIYSHTDLIRADKNFLNKRIEILSKQLKK